MSCAPPSRIGSSSWSCFLSADPSPLKTERRRVSSGSPFEKTIGFSRAIRIGDRVIVSGTAPVWPDGSVDPDPYVQARRCFEIIATALGEAGASVDDVVAPAC